MRRFLRVLLPIILIVAVVAIVVAVVTARPELDDDKKAVNSTWTPLAAEVDARDTELDGVNEQLRNLSGPVQDLADETHDALVKWRESQGKSVATRVAAANRVEELRRRLITAALASERVKQDEALTRAVNGLAEQAEPGSAGAYNAAVDAYTSDREGPVIGVVAPWLGYGEIPRFAVGSGGPAAAPATTTVP